MKPVNKCHRWLQTSWQNMFTWKCLWFLSVLITSMQAKERLAQQSWRITREVMYVVTVLKHHFYSILCRTPTHIYVFTSEIIINFLTITYVYTLIETQIHLTKDNHKLLLKKSASVNDTLAQQSLSWDRSDTLWKDFLWMLTFAFALCLTSVSHPVVYQQAAATDKC